MAAGRPLDRDAHARARAPARAVGAIRTYGRRAGAAAMFWDMRARRAAGAEDEVQEDARSMRRRVRRRASSPSGGVEIARSAVISAAPRPRPHVSPALRERRARLRRRSIMRVRSRARITPRSARARRRRRERGLAPAGLGGAAAAATAPRRACRRSDGDLRRARARRPGAALRLRASRARRARAAADEERARAHHRRRRDERAAAQSSRGRPGADVVPHAGAYEAAAPACETPRGGGRVGWRDPTARRGSRARAALAAGAGGAGGVHPAIVGVEMPAAADRSQARARRRRRRGPGPRRGSGEVGDELGDLGVARAEADVEVAGQLEEGVERRAL